MTRLIPYLTLALALAFAASPLFTAPFTGFRADQLPVPQVNPPVQPAGYAFAIWGLIYLWLIVSGCFGVYARRDDPAWRPAQRWLSLSLAVGVPWLAIANASAVWATVAICVMAVSAILALLATPRADRWWLQAPVALYAGWLTAASFVALASTAAGFAWLTGAVGWAFAGIAGALVVALLVSRARPAAPEYLATVIWALVGIVVANGLQHPGISGLAAGGALVLLVRALRSGRAAA